MSTTKKTKTRPLNYFFYNGELHKKIRINKSADLVIAWSYPQGRAVKHIYSDVRKNGERAFTTTEVGLMVNRKRKTLINAIDNGMIPVPQSSYGIDENRNKYGYYWCEKDILNLHDFLLTQHYGRPRKDGLIFPAPMPSRAELRALVRQSRVFYVQNEDGEFVPTWKAETF